MRYLRIAIVVLTALGLLRLFDSGISMPGLRAPRARARRTMAFMTVLGYPFAGISLSYLLTATPGPMSTGVVRFFLETLLLAMEWMFVLVSLRLLAALGAKVLASKRLFRGELCRAMITTHKIRRLLHPEDTLLSHISLFVMLITINAVALEFASGRTFLSVLLLQLANVIHTVGSKALPPSVLFLSASRADTLVDQLALHDAVAPLVVASLIDSSLSSAAEVGAIDFVTFRAESPALTWNAALQDLAELSRLIVLDVRAVTDNMRTELAALASQGLGYKTLILTEDEFDRRRFEQEHSVQFTTEFVFLNRSELFQTAAALTRSAESLPMRSGPIGEAAT